MADRSAEYIFRPPSELGRMQRFFWAMGLPVLSILGNLKLKGAAKDRPFQKPDWPKEQRNVLITGSGPSLDNVSDTFFDQYTEIICVNFSIKRLRDRNNIHFFTTDIGVLINLVEDVGWEIFEKIGSNRCVVAPIFFEQFHLIGRDDRKRLTWLAADRQKLKIEKLKNRKLMGKYSIPYSFRAYPTQLSDGPIHRRLNVSSKTLEALPILEHTSALSAICLAASMGTKNIDLIGCDFSAGRSQTVETKQRPPTSSTFSEAAGKYVDLEKDLQQRGYRIRNLSWSHGLLSRL